MQHGVTRRIFWPSLPLELSDDFFRLKSGLAGEIVQKFVTYGLRLAVVGDISSYTNGSKAFRDFVHESNKGMYVWFVADKHELAAKLNQRAAR